MDEQLRRTIQYYLCQVNCDLTPEEAVATGAQICSAVFRAAEELGLIDLRYHASQMEEHLRRLEG